MVRSLLLFLATLIIFRSCVNNNGQQPAVLVGSFTELPHAFRAGCTCLLTANSGFVLVNDNNARPDGSGAASMMLDGKVVLLNRMKLEPLQNGGRRMVYEGEGYRVELSLTEGTSTQPEPVPVTGSLQVSFPGKAAAEMAVTGHCGC
ncbi:MAG TPA: hypothetical protein PKE63_02355 [Lacibacter sp.]|nr:hypothetical protein [Lacibacter sp.]HMO90172.1 hypothetical protein [Lacibacter sp.]HMP86087.1 hypothetical protein [Lacibacter sp.]